MLMNFKEPRQRLANNSCPLRRLPLPSLLLEPTAVAMVL
jgi:hypothetical protein